MSLVHFQNFGQISELVLAQSLFLDEFIRTGQKTLSLAYHHLQWVLEVAEFHLQLFVFVVYAGHLLIQHWRFLTDFIASLLGSFELFLAVLELHRWLFTLSEMSPMYFSISATTSSKSFLSILASFLESWQYFLSGRLKIWIPFSFLPRSLSSMYFRTNNNNFFISIYPFSISPSPISPIHIYSFGYLNKCKYLVHVPLNEWLLMLIDQE